MSGAATMKMMSSTSITSTIGVTLISARVPFPEENAIGYLKKWRFTMLRKSDVNSCIWLSSTRMRDTKEL